MSRIAAYAGVARAPFLALPVVLVASGAGAAAAEGAVRPLRAAIALVGLLALHAAVNALNEASDMRTGIDLRTRRTPFSGGSGTLPDGKLPRGSATALGVVCSAIGLAAGVYFSWVVGWGMIPFLLAGALLVLGYTDLLARAGVGEIAAGLGLGFLPVVGTAFVQDGRIGPAALAAGVPAFFMTFNLLLLNEFPDEGPDREGGRRNLVLLLGRRRAAGVYAAAGLATPGSILIAGSFGWLPPATVAAILPSLFLAKPLRWAFREPDAEVPTPALGANVVWNLATNAVLAAALFLAAALRP